jgi:hypothetical protein
MQKGTGPPALSDFSPTAISKAVKKESWTHWLTLYPSTIAVLSGLAGCLFSSPSLILLALGGVTVGAGNAVVSIFFRKDAIGARYLSSLQKALIRHEEEILKSLGKDLEKCATLKEEACRDLADRGLEQFNMMPEKFQNVRDLLEHKLNATELTFGRFLGAAEQVYLGGLDNLKRVADLLISVSDIDLKYITERLKKLSKCKKPDVSNGEAEALQKQVDLYDQQLKEVEELLVQNEKAMTKIEETTIAIAHMNTGNQMAGVDTESAISDLHELVRSAYKYNSK